MNVFLMCFTAGACLLLGFMLFFHPLGQNLKANRWLALFVFLMGSSFLEVSLRSGEYFFANLSLWLNALQFIMAPSLWLSTLYFVNPTKSFVKKDLLQFLPFLLYTGIAFLGLSGSTNLMLVKLFSIGSADFLVRDIVPVQLAAYITFCYLALIRHKKNLRLIAAATSEISLNWLRYFLLILIFMLLFWINDALIGLPQMLDIMPVVYTGAVFFLSYFSIRQRTIFEFDTKELQDITALFEAPVPKQPKKTGRLDKTELALLSAKLDKLVTEEKIFLDNGLSLPVLADKLGISIHDASYLINEATGGNFYNFINSKRVEEAKRLLASDKVEALNMVGIAFASGFNSKTAFNTAFKKCTGMSPTEYAKSNNRQ